MLKQGSLSEGKRYSRGDIIARDGDAGTEMYFIVQGQAGVLRNYRQPGEVQVALLSPGDFFGEMSLFLGRAKTATLIAVTDVVALAITRENAADFFGIQPGCAVALAASLCQRLDAATVVLEGIYFEQSAPAVYAPPRQSAASVKPVAPAAAAPAAAPAPKKKPAPPQPSADEMRVEATASAPAADAPSQAPVDGASIIGAERVCSLFLPGHKEYSLPLNTANNQYLFEKSHTCPQCGKTFPAWAVRQSKLVAKSTDKDRRARYNGVEPLYFDVITCPACWFSATVDSFKDGAKRREAVAEKLAPYRAELFFPTELAIDTVSVFAGHYLAVECAPVCYPSPNIVLGKLWQKISRIYSDCGDGEMEIKAAQKAHDFYMTAYTKTNISPRQNQQLCVIIAELAFKLGDIKSARNFFFRAKTDSAGNAVLKRHAEDRIEDIRDYMEAAGISE